jgi:hypothetical protein
VVVFTAVSAGALPQYTPGANDRINNFFDPPNAGTGTPYASTSQGVSYSSTTGEATVSGTVSTLNYHVTGDPTVNIAQTFSPALTFSLELELVSITLTPNAIDPSLVDVLFDYRTTDDGLWDLVLTDPKDGGQVVLRADLNAGGTVDVGVTSFEAPTGLRATAASVDPNNPSTLQVLNAHGVFDIDQTSLYAPLFQDSAYMLGFEIGTVNQFDAGNPSTTNDWVDIFNALDCSGAPVCDTSTLISHTANAQGSVFGIASGDFIPVPEPGTLALVGAGLLGLAGRRLRGEGRRN